MSQQSTESKTEVQSETEVENETEQSLDNNAQMMPVTEAIKYRKRAQAAERQLVEVNNELQLNQNSQRETDEQLQATRRENDLTKQLVKSGVTDLEVALLLAENLLKNSSDGQPDVSSAIESIRRQRPSLFSGPDDSIASVAGPTAGVHSAGSSLQSSVSDFAQQAQRTGSRNDVCQYLRLRRMFK